MEPETSNSLVNPLAFIDVVRKELERIIGNELPVSIWAEVDGFWDRLREGYVAKR